MARINSKSLSKRVSDQAAPQLRPLVEQRAKQMHDEATREFWQEFENHSVTRELDGPTPENNPNYTNTLDGRGNLFSYIGFNQGRQPIEELREVLRRKMGPPRIRIRKRIFGSTFEIRTNTPTKENVEQDPSTVIGRYTGRSWLHAVRKGLAGFGHYFFTLKRTLPNSASTRALQFTQRLKSGTHRPISYLSPLLRTFRKRINKKALGRIK